MACVVAKSSSPNGLSEPFSPEGTTHSVNSAEKIVAAGYLQPVGVADVFVAAASPNLIVVLLIRIPDSNIDSVVIAGNDSAGQRV